MRGTRQHVWQSLVVVALAVALGWLGLRFSAGVDLTANQRHGLSEGTRAALAALTELGEPVEIVAVLGPDPAVRDAVRELVARYRDLSPDLSLRFVNPDTDPAAARALQAAPGGELILRTAGREQRLQRLDERALTGALRKLTREGALQIAFTTGHGERDPAASTDDDWQLIAERLAGIGLTSRRFSFVTEPRVPDDVDVLVIAAPRTPWLPGEVTGLIEHVRKGGNLLWLIETPVAYPAGAAADSPTSTGPGLSALASELGVITEPGRVIDTASQALVDGGPDFVVLGAHPDHPVTRALGSPLLLPQARALAVTPLAGQQTLPLLATPESSWTETGALAGEVAFDAADGEVAGPLLLGVTIERDLGTLAVSPRAQTAAPADAPADASADASADAPADAPADASAAASAGAASQRIAVIGDADLGSSRFVGNGGNAAFLESLMVWLAGDDRALAFVTVPAPDASLTLSSRTIVVLSVLCLVVVPLALLMVAAGVRIAMRRG